MTAERPQRMAAGWFLGFVLVALLGFAWLRGAGRLALPLLGLGLAAYAIARFLRKLREPVD